jgi:hypothetical protein
VPLALERNEPTISICCACSLIGCIAPSEVVSYGWSVLEDWRLLSVLGDVYILISLICSVIVLLLLLWQLLLMDLLRLLLMNLLGGRLSCKVLLSHLSLILNVRAIFKIMLVSLHLEPVVVLLYEEYLVESMNSVGVEYGESIVKHHDPEEEDEEWI